MTKELFLKKGPVLMAALLIAVASAVPAAAEEAREWVEIAEGGVEITVGPDGDFDNLNDALAEASGIRHRHNRGREGVVVSILPGYVLREQIHMYNTDLSHVRITGDENVPVDTTGFENADNDRGSRPVFNAQRGSEAPKIDVIFEYQDGPPSVGMLLNRGSSGVMTPDGGFVGFRDAVTVNNGSRLSARFSTLRGTRWGAHARHMSDANLRSADLSGGEIGVWARRASRIDARSADVSGDEGEGIRADNVSLVEGHGATLVGRPIGAHAFRGGKINLLNADIANTGLAMKVTEGGFIYAHEIEDTSGIGRMFSTKPHEVTADGAIFTDMPEEYIPED